ncbi:MAG: WecB/TagA/CpsF family glycosyltransferase [Acetobacteraceae bacterium]|nr:WecB/TagA/CpsF family glycosyltransferase [Acetobacteraceae bacterium]
MAPTRSPPPPWRHLFLGVPVDALDMPQTLALVTDAIRTRRRLQHVAINTAKFVALQHDLELRADVLNSDIVGVDGAGILLGARLFGIPIPERVTGVDLMMEVLALCAREGWRPYLLGATPEVLAAAVARLRADHPDLALAGCRDGYFAPAEEEAVAAEIAASGADCLFIGMPTPRKERFLARHRDQLGVPFLMGVGGSIDVLAGYVRRAPRWMQTSGLEWLFRVMQEPRRLWRRYLSSNLSYLAILVRALLGRLPPSARRPNS